MHGNCIWGEKEKADLDSTKKGTDNLQFASLVERLVRTRLSVDFVMEFTGVVTKIQTYFNQHKPTKQPPIIIYSSLGF